MHKQHLPLSATACGTKITASMNRVITPSSAGVSTTGTPNFGAGFAN